MYKISLDISKKTAISTLLLISILVIVPLSYRLLETDTASTQENISEVEMEKIANLDFNTSPEISKDLQSSIDSTMGGFNMGFKKNSNLDSGINYLLSSFQMNIRFLQSEIQLLIPNYKETNEKINFNPLENRTNEDKGQLTGPELIGYTVVTLEFVGSNLVQPIAEKPSASYFNYFYGSNPDDWISNVPSYQKLVYKNLYDDIDLIYTLNNGQLKYDFYVFPSGNYQDIQLRWNGPVSLQQSDEGLQINVSTLLGEKSIIDSNPINFIGTDREENVFGTFKLIDENTYGFSMEVNDRSDILIIDPVLEFSSFLGGSADERGMSLAIDSNGDVYITGYTQEIWGILTNFPTTTGAYDETYSASKDAFVTKLSANGSTLLYSTFLGGVGEDFGSSLAVDSNGDVYITGSTGSPGFPTTTGAYDESQNLGQDVFVTKLAANGSILLYSTFMGDYGDDFGQSLAIDGNGNVYITGYTPDLLTDFPTTTGAYDESHNGGNDVFVAKLSADGSTLLYSTFIGGSLDDRGQSLAIDSNGNVYITGYTDSTNFPTTTGVYDETYNEQSDVFVTKLSADGSTLLYSTFIGRSGIDVGQSLAIDSNGNVYITGYTDSRDFPTTTGAYDETYNEQSDVFVTKLSADGSTLLYSTFIGGFGFDAGQSLTINSNGDVYITGYTGSITGYTGSTYFPTTTGAYDETHRGGNDVFLIKLAANGSTLLYSTFIGGTLDDDRGQSLAINNNGDVYITGYTRDGVIDFPTTTGAYDESHNGGIDVFVAKLHLKPRPPYNIKSISKSNEDGSSIFLFWDKPDEGALNIASYKVYRGTASGNYSYLGSSPGSQSYFNDSSVMTGQAYYYVITAVNTPGESLFSLEYYTIIQPLSEPTEPQNVQTSTVESLVKLTWGSPLDDGGSAVLEYKIYRGTSTGIYSLVFVTSLTEFYDTFIAKDTTYYYVITAVNAVGESIFSAEVNALVLAPTGLQEPASPVNLQATAGQEFVYLSWDSPPDDGGSAITEYRVYRGANSGNSVLIFITTLTEFNDTFVDGGTKYYYSISAVNVIGESGYSSEVNATPLPPDQQTAETETSFITVTVISSITETEPILSNETKTERANFPLLPVIVLILIISTLRGLLNTSRISSKSKTFQDR